MKVQRALVELMKERTVIAVAHRLSTLVNFERILVVVDGKVVEEGTVAQLRARRGVFEKLWRLQTEGVFVEGQAPAPASGHARGKVEHRAGHIAAT
jgi:ATP-binding cassette, subfamily B, bacterial